jgi:hypothetical protein
MRLTDALGNVVDITTGEIVGRDDSVLPANIDPRSAARPDLPVENRVQGLVNNLSWGFNSALFALPDMATKGFGKAMGMKDDEVTTLSKIFNRGEMAPRDAAERYARAIGEGTGATAPFTGILAWAAKTRPMAQVATPSAGILKNTADDIIKYVQKSPRQAAAMDIAFSAGYETLRQAVEENVDDSNPNKGLYKELLPAAAFIGGPAALSLSPTYMIGKAGVDKIKGSLAGLGEVEREAIGSLPNMMQLPGIRIMPQLLLKRAEKKLEKVFGPIADSDEARAALRQLEEAMLDPRIAEAGFMFDVAERTLYGPLLAEKMALLERLGPKELSSVKQRINENQAKLENLFQSFAPEARAPVEEAFRAAQAQRQQFFDGLLTQRGNLTDAEKMRLGETFGPANPDMINDELRGILYSGMEMDAQMRQNILSRMGLRQAISPEGLPLPTRSEGKSLFPATNMEDAAIKILEKYRIERPTLRSPVPEPIRLLENFIASQQAARAKLEGRMMVQLTDDAIATQMRDLGKDLPADFAKAVRDAALVAVRGDKVKGKGRSVGLGDIAAATASDGTMAIPTGIPGRKVFLNPAKIREDAALIARSDTEIDINLPEGLDYLESAMRFRNESLMKYNNSLKRGRSRLTDAQRYLDTGDAVFKDMEQLVLGHVPRIKSEYNGLRTIVDDYRSVYEDTLPLLTLGKGPTAGAQKFLVPNEQVLERAFQSADGVRNLSSMIGNDPRGKELLEKGTLDWLRNKNIFNKDGLVDPTKIRSVLDKNANVVQALPTDVRTRLQNEVDAADLFIKRTGELDARRVQAADAELDRMLAQATRPDADPAQSLEKALQDPAAMRKLVQTFGKDPEMLGALRRSVYEVATGGAKGDLPLESFLRNNEKSLKVLFNSTSHYDDMLKLADLQKRVNAFSSVTGQIPAFQSLDENLKSLFGSGVQYLTTTMREAAVGRIRPETGALALFLRLGAGTETKLYNSIFTKALENQEFAKSVTRINTPVDAVKATKALESIGINVPKILQAGRTAQLEFVDEVTKGDTVPTERPRPQSNIARQMLKAMPPAPSMRGVPEAPQAPQGGRPPLLPTTPQVPARQQVELMYPQMFPNDPISSMLLQRQQQLQSPQQ